MEQEQQGQAVYDVYLTFFGKARLGMQMESSDFKDPTTAMPPENYTGRQLVAAALGVIDGKMPHPQLMTKSQLEAKVDSQMK